MLKEAEGEFVEFRIGAVRFVFPDELDDGQIDGIHDLAAKVLLRNDYAFPDGLTLNLTCYSRRKISCRR